MPTYDYECRDCNATHEQFHSMKDKPGPCPECGSKRVTKVILGAPAMSMPDGMWEYENDGRGRYIGGLGKRDDPNAYFRSRREAVEAAKSRGKQYELG